MNILKEVQDTVPEEKKVGIFRWGASEVSPDRLQLGNVHGGVVVNGVLESQLHICLGKMFSLLGDD